MREGRKEGGRGGKKEGGNKGGRGERRKEGGKKGRKKKQIKKNKKKHKSTSVSLDRDQLTGPASRTTGSQYPGQDHRYLAVPRLRQATFHLYQGIERLCEPQTQDLKGQKLLVYMTCVANTEVEQFSLYTQKKWPNFQTSHKERERKMGETVIAGDRGRPGQRRTHPTNKRRQPDPANKSESPPGSWGSISQGNQTPTAICK